MEKKDENSVVIYVDTRETLSNIAGMLAKKCVVREKRLAVADYLLSERLGVERKTTNDFISSIMDGRVFRQLYDLKQEFELPILIIEGRSIFESEVNIHPNAVRGAVASVAINLRIPIIWTRNAFETAEMLFALAKKEQIKENKSIAIRGKRKFRSENQMQEFLVAGLPKISTQKAKSLLKHFGSPEKIFSATEEELQEVPGIGKGLARDIMKLVRKQYEKSILED